MANDDQRPASATTDDIKTAERPGVVQQRPKVPGRFAFPVASDRHPTRVVATFLGHDHIQHAVGNAAKAQHKVVYITNAMHMVSMRTGYVYVFL